jgi:ParB-like chromosome segregation protein Spo0J
MPTNLAQARLELQKLVLLESVAEGREERIRTYLRHLVDDFGFEPDDLARRLGISRESIDSLLSTTEPSTVAEKLELSDESIRDLLDD